MFRQLPAPPLQSRPPPATRWRRSVSYTAPPPMNSAHSKLYSDDHPCALVVAFVDTNPSSGPPPRSPLPPSSHNRRVYAAAHVPTSLIRAMAVPPVVRVSQPFVAR
ncbi:hypothetical protein ACP70R_015692 [Stipagrostis hirtigluma subsp. patula]